MPLTLDGTTGISGIATITATGSITVGSGVTIGTSSISVGNNFIGNNKVSLGQTDTTGRNAGVGTAAGTLVYN